MKRKFLAKSAAFLGTLAIAATMAVPASAVDYSMPENEVIKWDNLAVAGQPITNPDEGTISGTVGEISYLKGGVGRVLGTTTYDIPEYNPVQLDKPMRIYVQWEERGKKRSQRFVSPIFYTDTTLDGKFTFKQLSYYDVNKQLRQFDGNPHFLVADGTAEKIRMWVDATTIPDGYEVAFSYGVASSPQTYTIFSPGATWTGGKVQQADVLLRKKPVQADFHRAPLQTYTPTDADWKLTGNPQGRMAGKVFWHLTDSTAMDNLPLQLGGGNNPAAAGVKVRASYLSDKAVENIYAYLADPANFGGRDRFSPDKADGWTAADEQKLQKYIKEEVAKDPSWVAETVETTTNDEGKYVLRFNGTYGRDRSFPLLGDNFGKIDYGLMAADKRGTVAGSPDEGDWYRNIAKPTETKHVNWEWMYVSLPELQDGVGVLSGWSDGWTGQIGGRTASNYSPARILGTNARQLTGSAESWEDVNFGLQPNDLQFYVPYYDTQENTAPPGATANTVTKGVPVFVTKPYYQIEWTDEDGTVVGDCDDLSADKNGNLESCDLKVPDDLLGKKKLYTASLYLQMEQLGESVLGTIPEQCSSIDGSFEAALDRGDFGPANDPEADAKYNEYLEQGKNSCAEFFAQYPVQCYDGYTGPATDTSMCPKNDGADQNERSRVWLARDAFAAGITPTPVYGVSNTPVSDEPTFSYPAREGVYEGKEGIARADVNFADTDAFVVAAANTVNGAEVNAETGVVTIPKAEFEALAKYDPDNEGTLEVPIEVTYESQEKRVAPAKFQNNKDGDGDGVPDWGDACPDTPEGAEVDSDGCSVAPKGMTVAPVTGVVNKSIEPVAAVIDNPGKWIVTSCEATGLPDGLDVMVEADSNTCVIFGTSTVTADAVPVTVTADFKAQDTILDAAQGKGIAPRVGELSADTTATIVAGDAGDGDNGNGGDGNNGGGLAHTGPAVAGLLVAMGAMLTLGGGAVARRYREEQ
ncbi:MAG: hypothetical protein Q4E03_01170 [Trueperella sp.]|nr:hypothetical protein [Trueperella sp.]